MAEGGGEGRGAVGNGPLHGDSEEEGVGKEEGVGQD